MTAPGGAAPVPVARRTATGAGWMIATRLASRVLDFATLLVLARLLSPPDFGLVALAMSLIYIVEAVLELPLNQVLVQLDHITQQHLDTAFTLGLARGLLVALALIGIAWPFAAFYHDPRLLPLVAALSLAPAARGMVSPALAIYAKQGSFTRDFVFETGGKIAATAVALAIALSTGSYWAIAAGTITAPVVNVIISYVLAPTRVRISLRGSRQFADFMSWTTGAQLLMALNWQADRLVIGRVLPAETIGRFAMASDLSFMPDQLMLKPMARPIMSAFVSVRTDPERLRAGYERVNRTISTLVLPLTVLIAVLATPLLRLALGEKWLASGPLLTGLAFASIGAIVATPQTSLSLALGKPNSLLLRNVVETAFKLPILVIGIPLLGVTGALLARMVSSVVVAVMAMVIVRRLIGCGLRRQLLQLARPVVASAAMALVCYAALPMLSGRSGMALALGLGAAGMGAVLVYAGVLLALAMACGVIPGTPEATALAALRRLHRPANAAG